MKLKSIVKTLTLTTAAALVAPASQASTDYGPAIWRPAYNGHWYTSGYGKKFFVEHDIEGYYWSCISYFQQSGTQASVHYTVNGKKDNSSDANPGEVTQMVSDAYYAWHAKCWNQHSMGTEHEGFVSNPAWFTPELYAASAALTKSKCEKYGFSKDRNRVIGHDQKRISGWPAWASANLGIDPNCNSHTDPGLYWDWTGYMALVNGSVNNAAAVSSSYPSSVTVGQTFSATVTMNNSGTTYWVAGNGYNLGSQNPQDNSRWGLGRVAVAGTVSPNANGAFTFNCTAPTTAGTYAFDWKMVQDGVEWFGATSTGTIVVNPVSNAVIVDNQAAAYTGSSWVVGSSAADKYGADYRYRSTAAISEPATFTANLTAGARNVYAWWAQGANRSATAPYVVYHAGGSTTVPKNQQANGGSWQLLGNFNFNAGNNNVVLSCWTTTGFVVLADAVKWGN